MDIEKLIRRLRNDADAYRNGETLGRAFADQEDVLDNAATALSTLQAENEKLRAEMEQIKAERDAAVEDLRQMCVGGIPVHFAKSPEQTASAWGLGGKQLSHAGSGAVLRRTDHEAADMAEL